MHLVARVPSGTLRHVSVAEVSITLHTTSVSITLKRFRRGLVFEAHRCLYHSTLGPRVIKKTKKRHRISLAARQRRRRLQHPGHHTRIQRRALQGDPPRSDSAKSARIQQKSEKQSPPPCSPHQNSAKSNNPTQNARILQKARGMSGKRKAISITMHTTSVSITLHATSHV